MRAINLILLLILTSSCASYVQKMHNQISADERGESPQAAQRQYSSRQKKFYDPYNGYRGIPVDKRDARPIENPLTLGGPQRSNPPPVKRNYSKRYTADDLKDNSDGSSLWNGKNSESFLFVQNNVKRKGDVVIVEVLSMLKDNITNELKRAYPEPKRATSEDEEKKEVVEEVNKDYLMVRGRKEVLFKERKRYVELRALVSRKDIKDNDTVSSKSLLEPKVTALRY